MEMEMETTERLHVELKRLGVAKVKTQPTVWLRVSQEDRRKWTQLFPLRFQSQEKTSQPLWLE